MQSVKKNYLSYEEKIQYHMERVLHYKEFGYTYPASVTLGLVTYCDQYCKGCYAGGYRFNPDIMTTVSLDVLKHYFKSAAKFGEKYEKENHPYYSSKTLGLKSITLVGSGEPLLYPHLTEFIEYAKKQLNLDIGIYTNGNNLKDNNLRSGIDSEPQNIASLVLDNCKFVRISLDAATAETHFKERGVKGQFNGIMENIANLVKKRNESGKTEPVIGIQFAIDDNNFHEILSVAKLAKEVGVDYLAYKPKYAPWDFKQERMTNMIFDDVKDYIERAQKLKDEKFEVHGKFEQFKTVWGPTLLNDGKDYKMCTGEWISGYLDVDVFSENKKEANMRFFLMNKSKEEKEENGELKWGSAPINLNTDIESFYINELKKLHNKVKVRECVAGCRHHPLNIVINKLLKKDDSELKSLRKDIETAPSYIHVNHL